MWMIKQKSMGLILQCYLRGAIKFLKIPGELGQLFLIQPMQKFMENGSATVIKIKPILSGYWAVTETREMQQMLQYGMLWAKVSWRQLIEKLSSVFILSRAIQDLLPGSINRHGWLLICFKTGIAGTWPCMIIFNMIITLSQ